MNDPISRESWLVLFCRPCRSLPVLSSQAWISARLAGRLSMLAARFEILTSSGAGGLYGLPINGMRLIKRRLSSTILALLFSEIRAFWVSVVILAKSLPTMLAADCSMGVVLSKAAAVTVSMVWTTAILS